MILLLDATTEVYDIKNKMAASKRSTRSTASKKSFISIPKISTPKIDFSMKTNAQKFLFFSAFTIIAYGFAALFAPWETFGKLLMPILPASGVTEKSFSQWKEVFATFSFGWAVGKIVAASSSQKATKLFCQLNSLPMTYFVYCCHKAQTFDWPTWALFLTAYVYFGYLAK
ncbi:unnamed protein product [Bathycoccus prasinos]